MCHQLLSQKPFLFSHQNYVSYIDIYTYLKIMCYIYILVVHYILLSNLMFLGWFLFSTYRSVTVVLPFHIALPCPIHPHSQSLPLSMPLGGVVGRKCRQLSLNNNKVIYPLQRSHFKSLPLSTSKWYHLCILRYCYFFHQFSHLLQFFIRYGQCKVKQAGR